MKKFQLSDKMRKRLIITAVKSVARLTLSTGLLPLGVAEVIGFVVDILPNDRADTNQAV